MALKRIWLFFYSETRNKESYYSNINIIVSLLFHPKISEEIFEFVCVALVLLAQAQELVGLGDRTSQVEGQLSVVVELKAEVDKLTDENTGGSDSEPHLQRLHRPA